MIARSILLRGEVGGPTWGRYYDPATRSVVIGTGVGSTTAAQLHGNDLITGGSGNDILFGGAGNDTYWVRTADLAQAAPPEGQQPSARTVIKDTEGRNVIRLDALLSDITQTSAANDQSDVGLNRLSADNAERCLRGRCAASRRVNGCSRVMLNRSNEGKNACVR